MGGNVRGSVSLKDQGKKSTRVSFYIVPDVSATLICLLTLRHYTVPFHSPQVKEGSEKHHSPVTYSSMSTAACQAQKITGNKHRRMLWPSSLHSKALRADRHCFQTVHMHQDGQGKQMFSSCHTGHNIQPSTQSPKTGHGPGW